MGKKKKKMSREKRKGIFMKIIIAYCLAFIAFTNIWALYILKTTGYNAYSIINSINLVHGGELLLCCVKKILSDPPSIKKKNNKSNDSNTNTSVENIFETDNSSNSDEDLPVGETFIDNHSDVRGDD